MATTIEEAERALAARSDDEKAKAAAAEDVPPFTIIDLDVVGERKRRYQGRFYYEVPTISEVTRIAQLRSQILPEGTPDRMGALQVEALTYLSVCIRFSDQYPKPDWYQPSGRMYDMTPFTTLFGRCREHEARFRFGDALAGDAGEGTGDADDASAGDDEAPVGRKVQPPAKRRQTLAGDDEGSP